LPLSPPELEVVWQALELLRQASVDINNLSNDTTSTGTGPILASIRKAGSLLMSIDGVIHYTSRNPAGYWGPGET
jgi:hypothetical protein